MLKKLEGCDVTVVVGDDVISYSTNCTLNITLSTADVTTKDSPGGGRFDDPEGTTISWDVSNESFVSDVNDMKSLIRIWLNAEKVSVKVNAGVETYIGGALITSLDVNAAVGDKVTMRISLKGVGPLK